jgi:hypothetical protein
MLHSLRPLALAALIVVALSAHAAAIHLSFTNSSAFSNDQVYVWVGGAAEAGYDIQIAGQSQNITLGRSYSLNELAAGLTLNRLISGRVYFSFGEPLPDPGRNAAGSPIRYPGVFPGDDGYNTRWDFVELTNTPAGPDVADLTSMDNFGIPLHLQLKHQGTPLDGPNSSAGWKGHTDAQVVAALSPLAVPAASNVYRVDGKFIRVRGATSIPMLYQNQPSDPRSMTAYLTSIRAAGRTTVVLGNEFATDYEYAAALDATGNYVLTKTGGGASVPQTIVVPASYKAGPNPADPVVTLADSIYMANPWYSVDGGPVGPTQNDLAGAVARDLYAALNLGYINSDHIVSPGDTVDASLVGKRVHELNTLQMRRLTIGFEEVNEFHNFYAAVIRDLSDSYGFAYSDWNEHLSKVAVLLNQPASGVTADELNVEIFGSHDIATIAGDYNLDGTVDAADYTIWRDSLHQSGPALAADGNGDGTVNAADYDIWKSNFSPLAGAASAVSVPEPASALFALIVCWIECAVRRGRRRNAGTLAS